MTDHGTFDVTDILKALGAGAIIAAAISAGTTLLNARLQADRDRKRELREDRRALRVAKRERVGRLYSGAINAARHLLQAQERLVSELPEADAEAKREWIDDKNAKADQLLDEVGVELQIEDGTSNFNTAFGEFRAH